MKIRLIVAAVLLVAAGIPLGSSARVGAAASPPPNSGCYPNNESVVQSGGFTNAASGGQGSGEAEVTLGGTPTNPDSNNSWNVTMNVAGNVGAPGSNAPGSMSGVLRLVINLKGYKQPVIFTSRCITEAQNEGKPADDLEVNAALEGEFEGQVTGFPTHEAGTPAIASISIGKSTVPGELKYNLGIELGTTCAETGDEINSGGDGHGSFRDPGPTGHRIGMPSNSNDPACNQQQQQQQEGG